jgi:hypothetical protein
MPAGRLGVKPDAAAVVGQFGLVQSVMWRLIPADAAIAALGGFRTFGGA